MNTTSLFSLATDVVVGSTILMVAALSLGLLLKRLSAATRHFYWATLIVSLLILPGISLLSPKYSLGFIPSEKTSQPNPNRSGTPFPSQLGSDEVQSLESELAPVVPQSNRSPLPSNFVAPSPEIAATSGMSVRRILLLAWLTGSIGIGLWLMAGWYRIRRLIQQAVESTDPTIQSSCQRIAQSLRLTRPIKIKISSRTMMPMVIGSHRAVLVLPSSFSEWEQTRQQAVLSHELGHIKRYDCATQLLGQVLCAAYWFHPLSWIITRRLQSEAEAACDDLAIQTGSEPSQYAEHLLTIARSLKGLRILSGSAAPMAGHSRLEKRLRLILAAGTDRNQLSRNCALLCSTATIGASLIFSTIRITANNEATEATAGSSRSSSSEVEEESLTSVLLAQASESTPDNNATGLFPKTGGKDPETEEAPARSETLRSLGRIENTNIINLQSKLEKPTAILWQASIDQRVKKGDLILEFDQGILVDSIDAKRIELAKDQANIDAASASLNELLRHQETLLNTQLLSLKLAELKKGKGDADFRLRRQKAESDLSLSKRRLADANSNLSATLTRVKSGVTGQDEARAAEIHLEDSKAKLEQAHGLLDNLINHVKAYEEAEHQLTIQQAKSTIENAQTQSKNKIATAEAALQALSFVHDIKSEGLHRLKMALENSRIYAPFSGQIVAPIDRRGGGLTRTLPSLGKGALIRKNQPVIGIADLANLDLVVTTHFTEAQTRSLTIGQKATISVDAFPNTTIRGEVASIHLFESYKSGEGVENVFRVRVTMTDPPSNLLPGLTAMVEITQEAGR